jgi:DNA-binding YbaB/EbfC family protein
MKGPLAHMMKQAQEMQRKMEEAQTELAAKEVTGESGGGMVSVVMNGRNDVSQVHIDPAAAQDVAMLEDLVAAALNDAVRRVESMKQEQMSGLTDGMNLPPGFKLPF